MNKVIYTLTCARAGEKEIYERLISFFLILLGAPIQECSNILNIFLVVITVENFLQYRCKFKSEVFPRLAIAPNNKK